MKTKIALIAALIVVTLGLGACNTMEGLGRDARAAGDAITNAASDNKGY